MSPRKLLWEEDDRNKTSREALLFATYLLGLVLAIFLVLGTAKVAYHHYKVNGYKACVEEASRTRQSPGIWCQGQDDEWEDMYG